MVTTGTLVPGGAVAQRQAHRSPEPGHVGSNPTGPATRPSPATCPGPATDPGPATCPAPATGPAGERPGTGPAQRRIAANTPIQYR